MTKVVKSAVKMPAAPAGGLPEDLGLCTGFNARRLRANLARDVSALSALAKLGLDRAFVERIGLGIKEPYVTAAGVEVSGVLTYPLERGGGRTRYGYLSLAGVTANADHGDAWSPGEARPFGLGEGVTLIVLSNPMKALRARAAIERRGLAVSVLASSQPDRVPREWHATAYWARWDRVVLEEALPAAVRSFVAGAASRPVEVARGVMDHDCARDVTSSLDDWIDGLLSGARPYAPEVLPAEGLTDPLVGDFSVAPISLYGGVSARGMYYPFMIERRRSSVGGTLLCSYETLVVRTDGAVLEATTLPCPAGTPQHQRVHCLTDGTRIGAAPEPSRHATWSFASIQRFVAHRAAGRDPADRASATVLADVRAFLASRVDLPKPEDHWVVATFVAMTHMFRVFPAIPLLLIEGTRGSGKSELASAAATLSFNAVVMGQGSAASLVRVAQECGGLVVLDDAEGLSASSGDFGELSQCLKVGYRASTARKPITLASGRVQTFNFYGPRILTSTRGVEPILRSRCVTVATAPSSPHAAPPSLEPEDLRDELHVLGMMRVPAAADVFRRMSQGCAGRADEIWTPLLAVAEAFECYDAVAALSLARERHPG